jgi:SAM-dependent methyltransferase
MRGQGWMGGHTVDDRQRRRQDRRAGLAPERWTLGDSRHWLCSRAHGDVLEISIGTGLNLPHYPGDLALTAIDVDAQMLSVARSRANIVRKMSLVQADAARLPFAAASFDSVVCTLAMCEFGDRSLVLNEIYRVLRPGGKLLLLDHAQWRWPLAGRPATLAADVGFVRRRQRRMRLGLIERLEAQKPEAGTRRQEARHTSS